MGVETEFEIEFPGKYPHSETSRNENKIEVQSPSVSPIKIPDDSEIFYDFPPSKSIENDENSVAELNFLVNLADEVEIGLFANEFADLRKLNNEFADLRNVVTNDCDIADTEIYEKNYKLCTMRTAVPNKLGIGMRNLEKLEIKRMILNEGESEKEIEFTKNFHEKFNESNDLDKIFHIKLKENTTDILEGKEVEEALKQIPKEIFKILAKRKKVFGELPEIKEDGKRLIRMDLKLRDEFSHWQLKSKSYPLHDADLKASLAPKFRLS